MFQPPRCPNDRCPQHRDPKPRFFVRKGSYQPKCRAYRVPRYRCKTCRRCFSRQTFCADYRDHRPDRNVPLVWSLATGLGLRQTARNIGLSRRSTELKFKKYGRHLRRLNLNLQGQLGPKAALQLDEIETYEGRRNTRPLSLPLLIEGGSRYIIWGEAAPIRPRGKMSKARERAVREDEKRYGKRKDLSRRSVRRTLQRGAALIEQLEKVDLFTDEKSTYPGLAKEVFGEERLVHHQTNSRLVRDTFNPLFPINHTEAMGRDHMGRLRRESWLVSKKRRYLDLALHMWMAYRNLVRRRFNFDERSPAQILGFLPRRLRMSELLTWRQDWGKDSIHPLSRSGASIRWMERRAAA